MTKIMFHKDESGKSKVILSYASFIGTLLGIFASLITIFVYLNAIKLDIEVIKTQHEFRINTLEKALIRIDLNDRVQDMKIQNSEMKIQNHINLKDKNAERNSN